MIEVVEKGKPEFYHEIKCDHCWAYVKFTTGDVVLSQFGQVITYEPDHEKFTKAYAIPCPVCGNKLIRLYRKNETLSTGNPHEGH